MEVGKVTFKIVTIKSTGSRPLGKTRPGRENNNKIDHGYVSMMRSWIYSSQDWVYGEPL